MRRPVDTSDEGRERQLAAYRSMAPELRLRLAAEMSTDVQRLFEAGARARASRLQGREPKRVRVTFGELLAVVIGILDQSGETRMK